MRTMLVEELGGIEQLQPAVIAVPEPGANQVRVSARAIGVNYPDVLMIAGQYQARPPLPFSPGFEVAGRVSAIGEGVDHLAVGDRVVGTPQFGAYAEEVVIDAASCDLIPTALGYADAAVLPIAFGTALYALRDRAALAEGETLLVTGATGGTGSAAMKLGSLMGAVVVGAVGSEAKVPVAQAMGAEAVVVYGGEIPLRDLVKEATDGHGADVVFDPVGGDVALDALRCVAWGGRVLIVGFTSGSIPDLPANLLLLKGSSAVGVFWGRWRGTEPAAASAQLAELAQWVVDGKLDTGISASYRLEDARDALAAVATRRVTGKVVLTP